jgi:hypothetical protein
VGGTVPFILLILYIHFGIMTIPALDQYLAIGQFTLLATVIER